MTEITRSQTTSKMVSVIIPNYNGAKTIAEAVQSALALRYEPKEVIVVDDGSTDNSLDVLRTFDGKIRLLSGPNRGACHARNRGLEVAQGEWVQFLDSDDLLDPDKVALQVRQLEETGADLSICHGRVIPPTDVLARAYCRTYDNGDPLVFCTKGVLPILAPLHRTSVLRSVGGFSEGLSCSQERDLHMRLAASGCRFVQLPEVLFTVRRTAGSVSSNSLKVIFNHRNIVKNIVNILEENGRTTPERRMALASMMASDARWLLRNREFDKANEYFDEAERLAPGDGIRQAYGRGAYLLRRVLGPKLAERILYVFKKWR